MHTREIVELAGLVAEHGSALACGPAVLPPGRLNEYWLASKTRFDAWSRALKRHSQDTPAARVAESAGDARLTALLREILAAELLTRVWTAVLVGHDRRRGQGDIEPVARNLFLGQLEVRNRALGLLLHAPGVRLEMAVSLNRLRQRTERWADLLVGRLAVDHDVREFAHNPARAGEFAHDLRQQEKAGERSAWPVLLSSLKAAFRELPGGQAPHAALNQRVAAAILACFPQELFDGTGAPAAWWLVRLSSAAADAQGMIAELVALEQATSTARGRRLSPR